MYTINCKGKLLPLHQPVVMGIINATPDSFFEGHLNKGMDTITAMATAMLADGAAILDVGGQSTRPGSQPVTAAEEIQRVVPVIKSILQLHPQAIISIDTYYSEVAAAAVNAGASIINDISAGNMDAAMLSTTASLKVPFIAMHMQGTPATMQQQPEYENVVKEVLDFFIKKIDECRKAGIHDVIIDPGFGFGKTITHNFQLLKQLDIFKMPGLPVLAGLSRKGTIYKTLGITAEEALNGTTSLNTIALMNGACILRVHDVQEAMQAIQLYQAYQEA
jgi:dihydropteroate synthase